MEIIRVLIGPDEGNASALQLSVRAVVLLAFGILCIRIAGRRTFSQATPLDIIVAIIVGSNLSRAMTGKAPFFPDLAATLVLVGLHRALAMATFGLAVSHSAGTGGLIASIVLAAGAWPAYAILRRRYGGPRLSI